MHNSIAMKFLALCLAALSLLAVLGSAAGILGLAYMDLYETSYEEYYGIATQSTRQEFAANLVHRYASLELGGLPEQYLNDYYGRNWLYNTYSYGTFFYTIRDEQGNVVESTMDEVPGGGTSYELVVTNMRYRVLVEILHEDTDEAAGTSTTIDPVEEPDTYEGTVPTAEYELAKDISLQHGTYYDHDRGRFVEFYFVYEDLPPYTVELYLMPETMTENYTWELLYWLWYARYQMFWVLGIGILLFAACLVCLCVAAGRKRDSLEIKAGALNCIPLDLSLTGLILAEGCGLELGSQLLEHLLLYKPKIFLPVAIFWGYGLCLLIVAFFFACAAQFKTGNGYWWRNSLCGRAVKLTVWLWKKLIGLCRWFFDRLPRILRKLLGGVRNLILWCLNLCRKMLAFCWNLVKTCFRWLGRQIGRFFSLLPLMWQWLVTGAVMLIAVIFALMDRSEGLLVLALCGSFALILYGAGSFGQLLDAAKRMGKGDLETKVNDKHMVGCFKEFAGDLNALADVAVVAARNQLKSERMRTELITNVSHDIKTPLTSIINYVDLLQKPHTEQEQEAYLEVLSRQSGQLKKLIEDLMEMSKASTGNMTVEIAAVDAVEAVNQALGEFADKFDKVQLTPVFRQPEEPVYMKADGRLAWRVLSNLLSNAYKYALPGTRLYVDLMELEGKVLISLKNISREELNVSAEELLERFVRGDASRNTEGSGLGLNIAQSLMELQKGQLQLLVDGDLFKVTLVFPAARME